MRYLLEHSYLGTAYHGWQKQINAVTIQAILEEIMTKILGAPIELVGSSRTDTGVHAQQQMAHFDWPKPLGDIEKTVTRLNSVLPNDLAVKSLRPVADNFHCRYDALHRSYEYIILKGKDPFRSQNGLLVKVQPDLKAMALTAEAILHHHNFQSFSKIHTGVKSFECTVSEAQWIDTGAVIKFRITANRFLRGMVRALVGTMLQVGTGKISPEDFYRIVRARDRKMAGPNAPAIGLTLIEVAYLPNFAILRNQPVGKKANPPG